MKRRRFVAALMMAVAVTGTAGGVGAQTPAPGAPAIDVNALAGKWQGWWVEPSRTLPLEVTVSADGTYVSRIGSESGSGTFRIVNDVIITDGHLNGPSAPVSGRSSRVTVVHRAGPPRLAGSGHSEAKLGHTRSS